MPDYESSSWYSRALEIALDFCPTALLLLMGLLLLCAALQ